MSFMNSYGKRGNKATVTDSTSEPLSVMMLGMHLSQQEHDVVEYWYEKALSIMLEAGRLPLSDDVWATDKFFDVIYETAHDMYADRQKMSNA